MNESGAARKAYLFHDCFRKLLSTCENETSANRRLGRPKGTTDTIFPGRAVGQKQVNDRKSEGILCI